MDRGQHRGGAVIRGAAFDADGPLRHGGQHLFYRNSRSRDLRHAQTVQARHGKEGRNSHAIIQLFHPRLHIAAKLDQLQIRPPQPQLCPPPQAG